MLRLAAILFTVGVSYGNDGGDPVRGAAVLESRRCTGCHRLQGVWDTAGINKLFKTRLSPARLIGVIWNHAPQMWSGNDAAGAFATALQESDAADVLSYFLAAGYFEPIGDPRRGALRFNKLRCGTCHGSSDVTRWTVIANPVDLLGAMWQHAAEMKKAMDARSMTWPSLSTDDMRDLLSFIASRTDRSSHKPQSVVGRADRGLQLFQDRECAMCHQGVLSLDGNPFEHSLTELAASIWNHAPMLTRNLVPMGRQDIADLLAYLWKLRYFEETGNALRGKMVFEGKGCGSCHADAGKWTALSSAGALRAVWAHYRPWRESRMTAWPRFLGDEMADLVAYWNSRGGPGR